jgi:hypothetical protein
MQGGIVLYSMPLHVFIIWLTNYIWDLLCCPIINFDRYRNASAKCVAWICLLADKSAIVRAKFNTR